MTNDERPCGTNTPGRCAINGQRLMVHACDNPRLHGWKPHRCKCGHTWGQSPKPEQNDNNKRRGSRRKWERTTP